MALYAGVLLCFFASLFPAFKLCLWLLGTQEPFILHTLEKDEFPSIISFVIENILYSVSTECVCEILQMQ